MAKRVNGLILALLLSFIVMFVVSTMFPEFEAHLGSYLMYFSFIGLVLLLVSGRKH